MDFLADVWVTCPVCEGRRFNRETLQVRYKGKSIHDVLEMDVQDALEALPERAARSAPCSQTLHDVGLDYVKLGQPAPTLSGGEAQRVKLARELCRKATGRTLYVLDEPTTGLHFEDIQKLLSVLHGFVEAGNSVARHRTQPGRHQDGRLAHRPGAGGRHRRRRVGHRRHPRAGRRLPGVVHGPGARPGPEAEAGRHEEAEEGEEGGQAGDCRA